MRILTAVSILALAMTSQVAQAQERPGAKTAPKTTAKVLSSEESAAMADASRKSRGFGTCQRRKAEKDHERHLHRLLIPPPEVMTSSVKRQAIFL